MHKVFQKDAPFFINHKEKEKKYSTLNIAARPNDKDNFSTQKFKKVWNCGDMQDPWEECYKHFYFPCSNAL